MGADVLLYSVLAKISTYDIFVITSYVNRLSTLIPARALYRLIKSRFSKKATKFDLIFYFYLMLTEYTSNLRFCQILWL